MGDIVRPGPRRAWSERIARHLSWFGAGRLAGAAVSVAVVDMSAERAATTVGQIRDNGGTAEGTLYLSRPGRLRLE